MTVWEPGMRCVCIKVPPGRFEEAERPEKGGVYTVRSVVPVSEPMNSSGMVLLRLAEVDNSHWIGKRFTNLERGVEFILTVEPAFRCVYFRPLSETRLDQFRAYLAPVDQVPA